MRHKALAHHITTHTVDEQSHPPRKKRRSIIAPSTPIHTIWTTPLSQPPPTNGDFTIQGSSDDGHLLIGDIQIPIPFSATQLLNLLQHGKIVISVNQTTLSVDIGSRALDRAVTHPLEERESQDDRDLRNILGCLGLVPPIPPPTFIPFSDRQLFIALRRRSRSNRSISNQHPLLTSTLRSYQQRAVEWMLSRELDAPPTDDSLHPLWACLSPSLFVNKYSGRLSQQRFPAHAEHVHGGILADEMGLGKTVELLALILHHPWPGPSHAPQAIEPPSTDRIQCVCKHVPPEDQDYASRSYRGLWVSCDLCSTWQHAKCVGYQVGDSSYLCHTCIMGRPRLASGCTLIVAPAAIEQQIMDEVEKHAPSLHVLRYTGVKNGWIHPARLAAFDVVVTTYDVLRSDCHYPTTGDFVNPGRFPIPPCPLTAIDWWRVCLDETQMVEHASTKASEMACRLSSVNRWCISGTPVSRTPDDFLGAMAFLNHSILSSRKWFRRVFSAPYDHGCFDPQFKQHATVGLDLIGSLFWRTTRSEAWTELGIPPQFEHTFQLRLTAAERWYYEREHEACQSAAIVAMDKLDRDGVDVLDARNGSNVISVLTRLRMACAHPQVGREGKMAVTRSTLSPAQLLEQLVARARLAVEEQHRGVLFASNGLAALSAIEGDFIAAVDQYRSSLRRIESGIVKTDRLQRLHIIHNLSQLVSAPGVAPTLRDSSLGSEAEELRASYLQQAALRLKVSREKYQHVCAHVGQVRTELKCDPIWWDSALRLVAPDSSSAFVRAVNAQVDGLGRVEGGYRTLDDVYSALKKGHEKLERTRIMWHHELERLDANRWDSSNCPQCRFQGTGSICGHCRALPLLEGLEGALFTTKVVHTRMSRDIADQVEANLKEKLASEEAVRGQSEVERILDVLAMRLRRLKGDEDPLIVDSKAHFKLLRQMKKEFTASAEFYAAQQDHNNAVDELAMAEMRLRLQAPGEVVRQTEATLVIHSSELRSERTRLTAQLETSEVGFRRTSGQLNYLKHLQAAREALDRRRQDGEGEADEAICPLCREAHGTDLVIVPCGHTFHPSCIEMVVRRYQGRSSLPCPVCREPIRPEEICQVSEQQEEEGYAEAPDLADVVLRGEFGTKINALTRRLLELQKRDPTAKSLVFSTWRDVLSLVGRSLQENDVPFVLLGDRRHFQSSLTVFRTDPNMRVLLLPLKTGANGLNLPEASHVWLMEPSMSRPIVEQAVGRVYRIGQKRETHVSLMMAANTVDEKVLGIAGRRIKEEEGIEMSEMRHLFG